MRRLRRYSLLIAVVLLMLAVAQAAACGGDDEELAPVATATVTPVPATVPTTTPASTPTVRIRLSRADDPKYSEPIRLEVVTGEYQLVSGATALAGSDFSVREEWLTFPSKLAIDIGSGGVTLDGQFYPEGTTLQVQGGALVEVDEE